MKRMKDSERILANYSPHLIDEWHPTKNEDFTPWDVSYGSNKKTWWKCKECNYEWETYIKHRSKGSKCPKCVAKKASILRKNPKFNFEQRILDNHSPHLVEEWIQDKNGKLTPWEVTYGSRTVVWWKCRDCSHEWQAPIQARIYNNCPECVIEKRIVTTKKHSNKTLFKCKPSIHLIS